MNVDPPKSAQFWTNLVTSEYENVPILHNQLGDRTNFFREVVKEEERQMIGGQANVSSNRRHEVKKHANNGT